MSSAEGFARGGVALAHGLGCVDLLSFGSELGETSPLLQAAEAAVSPLIQEKIRLLLSEGFSYPSAREKAIETQFGSDISRLFQEPNNILAIEYCKALTLLSSPIQPITISEPALLTMQPSLRGVPAALPALPICAPAC